MVGKSWQQVNKAAGHILSTVRNPREIKTTIQSAFSCLFSPKTHPMDGAVDEHDHEFLIVLYLSP